MSVGGDPCGSQIVTEKLRLKPLKENCWRMDCNTNPEPLTAPISDASASRTPHIFLRVEVQKMLRLAKPSTCQVNISGGSKAVIDEVKTKAAHASVMDSRSVRLNVFLFFLGRGHSSMSLGSSFISRALPYKPQLPWPPCLCNRTALKGLRRSYVNVRMPGRKNFFPLRFPL